MTTRSAPRARALTISTPSLKPPETTSLGTVSPFSNLVLDSALLIEATAAIGPGPTTSECILEFLEAAWTIRASAADRAACLRTSRSVMGPTLRTMGTPPATDRTVSTAAAMEPSAS